MSTVAGVPIMIEEQQKPAALQANAAVKSFGRGRGRHQVLFDVNVEVWPGEIDPHAHHVRLGTTRFR